TKIIDIYIEPEENEEDIKQVNEFTWNNDSSWTNENAKEIAKVLNEEFGKPVIKYTQSYISLSINSKNTYWLHKRVKPNSALFFTEKDDEKSDLIKSLLEEKEINYTFNRYKEFMIIVDLKFINSNQDLLNQIHNIRFKKILEDE